MPPPIVTANSRVRFPPDVLFQELAGESVLLDLRGEKYFGLDATGTFLFEALKSTGTIAGAVTAGLEAFDVSREELTADVIELVERLAAEGLAHVEG